MNKLTLSQQNALKTGLTYGFGLVLGGIIASILFNTTKLKWLPINNEALSLIIGIIVALIITGFSAGIGGFIGGRTLENPTQSKSQRKIAWRSALSLGLPFGLFIYPIVFFISTIAYYGTGDLELISFAIVFLILGAIYGTIVGLILGLSTVGRGYYSHIVEAGLVGFSFGGLALGICIYAYLNSISAQNSNSIPRLLILLGLFLFNSIGGFALGAIYSELAHKEAFAEPGPLTKPQKTRRIIYSVIAICFVLFFVNSFADVLADMLTPQEANLATILDSATIGTHWAEADTVTNEVNGSDNTQPVIFAAADGQVSIVWVQDGDVVWASGNNAGWETPIQVTNNAGLDTAVPQLIIDSKGVTHIVWADGNSVQHSQCVNGSCTDQTTLATSTTNNCGTENDLHSATIAISDEQLLAAWSTGDALGYTIWQEDEPLPTTPTGCIMEANTTAQLQATGGTNGRFALAYLSKNNIMQTSFDGQSWADTTTQIGQGTQPDILLDNNQNLHISWCNEDNNVSYWSAGEAEIVSAIPCATPPEIGMDSNGRIHIIWYANQVQNQFSQFSNNNIIYETILDNGGWQLAAIVQKLDQPTIPSMSGTQHSDLHMAWFSDGNILHTQQKQYSCDNTDIPPIPQRMLTIAQEHRAPDNIIPYCNNQYDKHIVMPNPQPAYSDAPQTPGGGFDVMFDLARQAQYEVLFSTMWYDRDQGLDSPGYLLAETVAELYENIKANPEQYPRGLTVRILLGNPPEATRAEFSDQVWSALTDLHNAGVEEMVNQELGWRVEVADFKGALPHSHAKMMVVDGKTAIAAGYNMSYEHFPSDHPSGLGNGRYDLGLQMTGPVAQDAHRAFDDIWSGADQRDCNNLSLPDGRWQKTCREITATSDHAPEVLKYYLTDSNSNAFSMYRTAAFPESDKQIEAVFSNAQQTIDAMHVNFTMPMICDLNLLYDICDFGDATDYLKSLMDAAENGAKIRLLLKAQPLDGIESSVAVQIIRNEIEVRGLQDSFEFRYFDGPMHPKSALVDKQFLIVGSQNLHYSAFGDEAGLVEFSLGTDDPQAIEDYQAMFNYYWDRATP